MVLDPFLVDGDVTLDEMEFRIVEQCADALRLQVHAVDMPFGIGKNVLAQMMSDEAVDAENEHVFQDKPLRFSQINASGWFDRTGGAAPRSTGFPLTASSRILSPRPSTQSAYQAPSAAYRQGARAACRTGWSSTRVARSASLHPFTSVKAPGNGGATARTRLCTARAPWRQSMRPSSGR